MDIQTNQQHSTTLQWAISVASEDYRKPFGQKVKAYATKHLIPGFRSGYHATKGQFVRNRHGKKILQEVVAQLAQEQLDVYVQKEKIVVLGKAKLDEEGFLQQDWQSSDQPFSVVFTLDVVPPFVVDLEVSPEVTGYQVVSVGEERLEQEVQKLCRHFGSLEEQKNTKKETVVEGKLQYDDVFSERVTFFLDELVLQKVTFLDKRVGDTLSIPASFLQKHFPNNHSLGTIAEKATHDFFFTIERISAHVPASVTQVLFDKVLGPGVVTTKEAFLKEIQDRLCAQCQTEADKLLDQQLQEKWIAASGIELPSAYEHAAKYLKWQLFRQQCAEQQGIKVAQQEIEQFLRSTYHMLLSQRGITDEKVREENIDRHMREIMENPQHQMLRFAVDTLLDQQVMPLLREKSQITREYISVEAFQQMDQEKVQQASASA